MADESSSDVLTAVLSRLDAVAELVDRGKYHEAREALYGRRWTAALDLNVVPTHARERLQQWIDAAHDGLSEIPVDPNYVRNLLFQARRTFAR